MIEKFDIAEGLFEIQYRRDFENVSKYRKDYELFVVKFSPKSGLNEDEINSIFESNSITLFDMVDEIIAQNNAFFSHFKITKIFHGDCCVRRYDSENSINVIACYMKKVKFVTIDRQKLPVA